MVYGEGVLFPRMLIESWVGRRHLVRAALQAGAFLGLTSEALGGPLEALWHFLGGKAGPWGCFLGAVRTHSLWATGKEAAKGEHCPVNCRSVVAAFWVQVSPGRKRVPRWNRGVPCWSSCLHGPGGKRRQQAEGLDPSTKSAALRDGAGGAGSTWMW